MSGLLDQYGNPMQKDALLTQYDRPNVHGVRTFLSRSITTGLTPYRLARVLKAAEDGDVEDYLTLAEELEEKDSHYLSVMGTRKRAVSQLEITVEAASDDKNDVANAELIEDWLDRDQLQSEIFDILDAIGKGYSATEIIWDMSESQWLPKDIVWRDPRHFGFDFNTHNDLMMYQDHQLVPMPAYKFITHMHKAKSGLAVRGGLARSCAWMYLFKNFSVKDWVIFNEAYGQPIRVGKYGAGASDEDRNILMRAVANIGSDAAAIIPESMMIEFVEAGGKTSSVDIFERLAKFCDQQMSKAVIGQTTTVDAISGGHAVSKEHNEVREDIERSDAIQLQGTLNAQLIPIIVSLNRGPQKRYPRLRIGRSEQIDRTELVTVAEKAVGMGITVSKSQMRIKLGLPAPEEGDQDDILGAKPDSTDIASQRFMSRLMGNNPQAAANKAPETDKIADLSGELAEEWEEVMLPIEAALAQALSECASYEEFSQKMLEMIPDLNMDALTDKIAQANFTARIAGNLDIDKE